MLDYTLKTTNSEKCYVVAHSQGCTSLMVLLSLKPEFNDKIIQAHLMSPAVFMKDLPHPLIRFFASEFDAFVDRFKNYNLISRSQIVKFIEPVNSFLCQPNSPVLDMCANIILAICGRNDNGTEIDTKIIPTLTKYISHAVSTKQIHHFIQLYQSGKFLQYNYQANNKMVYNQSHPPEYPLKNVNTSIYLYSGINDLLVAERDIEHLKEVLPNVVRYKSIKNYNHCDYQYGKNSRKVLFNSILRSMSHQR